MTVTLQEIADRMEVGDLLAGYATALDTKDWGALYGIFAADSECDFGALGRPRGIPQIVELVRGALGTVDATQHLVGNVVVQLAGDEGRASCYLFAQHVREGAGGPAHYLLGGVYRDRVVRTPQGWRIHHRTLTRLWSTGDPAVVLRPANTP